MLSRCFLFLTTLVIFGNALAAEEIKVCARYETSNGWSKGYSVQARKLTGSEMNRATSSFNYESWSTYVVIFWDNDQASVIKMDMPYLSAIGLQGIDQEGRKWEIAKTSFCLY